MLPNTFILTTNGLCRASDLTHKESEIVCLSNRGRAAPFEHGPEEAGRHLVTTNGFSLTLPVSASILTSDGLVSVSKLDTGVSLMLSYTRGLDWRAKDEFAEGFSMGKIEVTMTESMLLRSASFLKGYLSGLFTARGGAYQQTNGSLRYVSSYNRLDLIQIVLAAFGIHSNIQISKDTRWINLTSSAISRFMMDVGLDGEIKVKMQVYMEKAKRPEPKLQREYTYLSKIEKTPPYAPLKTSLSGIKSVSANGLVVVP